MKSKEVDPRIKSLTAEVAEGKTARFIEEMVNTSLGFGRDKATIAEVKLMSRALREMRMAARLFAKYSRIRKVAVFGSARTKPEQEEFKQAVAFGQKIVEQGYMVITGGGDGIMGAAQKGAGAEKSFGLNIRLPFEQSANEVIHGDPKLLHFNYFFTRKLNFAKETHAFALFPGGFGTHDEGFEILTLMQTGKMPIVPVVMVDRQNGHYWETWRRFITNDLLHNGLISESDFNLIHLTYDVNDAVRHITDFYRNFHSYRWVREKMVIRIQRPLTPESMKTLNERFDSLLAAEHIDQTGALEEEIDDHHLHHMPRIVLVPHKRDFGKIRLLLNAINELPTREDASEA
jgi:uncharacterized protein (TIGR00730 family)